MQLSRRLYFESLESRRLLSLTGDAPNPPYPEATVTSDTGPTLGGSRLLDGGISFANVRVGELDALVSVNVQGAPSGGAQLDGWIDFNRDGSFSGAGELIFDGWKLANGVHDLRFEVPTWAVAGGTWSRFRLSAPTPPQGIGENTEASNGEVEDWPVSVSRASTGGAQFSLAGLVSDASEANGVVDVISADLNRDGTLEVVSASHIDGRIVVYRQVGNEWIGKHVGSVRSSGAQTLKTIDLVAADFDADGDLDLASASESDGKIAWYENPGSLDQPFAKKTLLGVSGARAVFAADFDQDGRVDLASASRGGGFMGSDAIRIHLNATQNSQGGFSSPSQINVGQNDLGLSDIYAADINNDGWVDIVSVSATNNRIAWYDNDDLTWDTHEILSPTVGPGNRSIGLFVTRVDNDSHLDVVVTNQSEGKVLWYKNPNNPNQAWSERPVASSLVTPYAPAVGDMDGDGDMDVVVPAAGEDNSAGAFHIYRNSGGGNFSSFGTPVIANNATAVFVADVNQDNVLDIVAGRNQSTSSVTWLRSDAPTSAPVGVRIAGGQLVPNGGVYDFGTVNRSENVKRVFEIFSVGTPRTIDDFQLIADSSDFRLTSEYPVPSGTVQPGTPIPFEIEMRTNVSGAKMGTVQIVFTNGESVVLQLIGNVVAPIDPPEIRVEGGVTFNGPRFEITTGDAAPVEQNGTHFGRVELGESHILTIRRTYTIFNLGESNLAFPGEIVVPEGFAIFRPPSPAVGANNSTNLIVEVDTSAVGEWAGQVLIPNNDADENPFVFAIQAEVFDPDAPVGPPGDYSGDTLVDHRDYGVWKASFGTSNLDGDGNGDGVVNLADYTIARDNHGAGLVPNLVPGDFDNHGSVDSLDYDAWKSNYGRRISLANDNGDGVVNLADYTMWRDNQGSSTAASVPVGSLATAGNFGRNTPVRRIAFGQSNRIDPTVVAQDHTRLHAAVDQALLLLASQSAEVPVDARSNSSMATEDVRVDAVPPSLAILWDWLG